MNSRYQSSVARRRLGYETKAVCKRRAYLLTVYLQQRSISDFLGPVFRKHSLRLAPSIGRDFHIDEFGKLVFKHAWPASQVS